LETLDEPPSSLIIFAESFFSYFPAVSQALDLSAVLIEILLIILGLFLGAVYSGAEVGFFSISGKMHLLEPDQKEGGLDSKTLKMLAKPRRLLATILIGNTVANVVVSVLAASLTGRLIQFIGAPEVVVFTVEVLVLSFAILILSEIAPKIFALKNPLKLTRWVSTFIYLHFILLYPFNDLMAKTAIVLERVLPRPTTRMTTNDLKAMAQASEREGSLKEDEREIIENVIEFRTITAREIMTSRVNIIAVSVDQTLEEVLELIQAKGLSRMPLYENDLDTIIGVLYAKDVLPFLNADPETTMVNWKTIARKPLFIPATKKLDALLQVFQQEKTHIAIVVDEYGGTEGVITMDDLLEEIVGDMADESDDLEEKLYTEMKSGAFLCDAKIDLDEVEELLGLELTSEDDEFETLGGLMYFLTERIPAIGEKAVYKGAEITVHSVRNSRIHKLRVKAISPKQSVA
jgi:CBS domain containing-hemolysin-like protein